ncbi:MAG: HisA/HisF-related TIM barrel protein [Pseudomonadota bacterium]
MDIIPVIDLKGGQVVHARAGAREAYLPIRTPLAPDATPLAVVEGLMGLHPFRRLYVADLDAIAQAGDHGAELARIAAAFPALDLWVDRGLGAPGPCREWLSAVPHRLVLGSESQSDPTLAKTLERDFGMQRLALSLDFRDGAFLGPPKLFRDAALWPRDVIVMTLARVGGTLGPDLESLIEIRRRAPERRIYGAGGVRDGKDLKALAAAGAAGVLVASALHDGRLGPEDLRAHEHTG